MSDFQLVSPFQPAGDQPQAIDMLVAGFQSCRRFQTLLGVTGFRQMYAMIRAGQRANTRSTRASAPAAC